MLSPIGQDADGRFSGEITREQEEAAVVPGSLVVV